MPNKNKKGEMMISEKHLAIVRAALTFWDEEMSGAEQSICKHYLHSKDHGTRVSASDVATVRHYFNNIELKAALIDKNTGEFMSESPVDPSNELSHQTDWQTPVAVLFPSQQ